MTGANPSFETLQDLLQKHGQGHLLRFWDDLSPRDRQALAADIGGIDFALVAGLNRGEGLWDAKDLPLEDLAVPDVWRLGRDFKDLSRRDAARRGEAMLRNGEVAVLVVAGGQGSRLGFDGPKGTLPFGPVSERTLFEIHCRKIRFLEKRYGAAVPFLVMTSDANDEATRAFFRENKNFGVAELHIFRQGTIPAVDGDGRMFLAAPHKVFQSPDGHGGTIAAFAGSGLLQTLMERGLTTLFYFQVDNPLVNIAEPFFVGAHALAASEYSMKLLKKTSPEDELGVLARHGGRHLMIEYSDLPGALRAARDAQGELLYWAGSPAIHVFSLAFFKRLFQDGLPGLYHCARKKIDHVDAQGRMVKPETNNGTKFEKFIFDGLPHAHAVLAVEGARKDEFAPVKSRTGDNSLDNARKKVSDHYWSWLVARGVNPPRHPDGGYKHFCEIDPLVASCAEDLPDDIARHISLDGPVFLKGLPS